MIPIDNFPAIVAINGIDEPYECQVVGVTGERRGTFEFVVVIDDGDERWVTTTETVRAPDGSERRPL